MTPKPLIARPVARLDVRAIAFGYRLDAGAAVADRFLAELDRAYRHIAREPVTGSLRYGHPLGVPGLRFWPLRRFPHLVFYVELAEHIDVLRVLHGKRDIPASLQTPD